jgi:hypothetical protein
MTSYEKRALLLELLVRKSGLSLPELVEGPEFLEDLTQEVFDDLQQSRQELRGQVGVESEPGMGSLFSCTLPAESSSRERMRVSPYSKQSKPVSDLSRSI